MLGGVRRVKKFLLSCECGATTPVSGGQAGDEVFCTGCGQSLAVPTLRELSQLPLAEETRSNRQRNWDASKGLLLLGGLLVVVSWTAAAWLRIPVASPVDPAIIRQNLAGQTDAEIYEAWRDYFSMTTVARPQMVIEKIFIQQVQLRRGLSIALIVSGGVGLLIGLAGAIGVGRRR